MQRAIPWLLGLSLFTASAGSLTAAQPTSSVSFVLDCSKQMGLGLLQYTQDYDEMLPFGNGGASSAVGWAGQMYPYVKSTQLYKCPNDTTAPAQG